MKYNQLLKICTLFYSLAEPIELSNIKINHSGMRPESIDLVRKQRASKMKMRPIEIEVYPDTGPILADGRHRLQIAKELGDQTIDAIIRYYNDEASVIKKENITLQIS